MPTVTELADAMVMDRSGLGHTLGPLERDGLITLAVDSEDARATERGLDCEGGALQGQATIFWARAQSNFPTSLELAKLPSFIQLYLRSPTTSD